jgi:hypothetical protein
MDDGPPSDQVVTAISLARVTLVNAVPDGERSAADVLRVDDDFVVVRHQGVERRFSRHTGFEIRGGGSWSTWRLAGADFRTVRRRK